MVGDILFPDIGGVLALVVERRAVVVYVTGQDLVRHCRTRHFFEYGTVTTVERPCLEDALREIAQCL